MFNTYGFRSINQSSFVVSDTRCFNYETRKVLMTSLRLNNLVFGILGYIPAVSIVTGSMRIMTGISLHISAKIASRMNPNLNTSLHRELAQTGSAQIARGILEAFVPGGSFVNAVLDVSATALHGALYLGRALPAHLSPKTAPAGMDAAYPYPLGILHCA